MSNKKQTPLTFLSKSLTDKINKYKELKTELPIQEFFKLKTDVLLLKEDEKEQIKEAYNQGYRDGKRKAESINNALDISKYNDAENYYNETFKND